MTTETPAPDASTFAWGDGLATIAADGTVLDTWFPSPALGRIPAGRERWIAPAEIEALAGEDERRGVRIEIVTIEIDIAAAPAGTSDAYLRLHLLSSLLAEPNTVKLDGIFPHLPIVARTERKRYV